MLPLSRHGTELRLAAVAENDEGVVPPELGNGVVLVVAKIVVIGMLDRHRRLLQLDKDERNAVDAGHKVAAFVVEFTADPHLLGKEEVVLLRVFPVDDLHAVGLLNSGDILHETFENGIYEPDYGEYYDDLNDNGKYDEPECFIDKDGDGICDWELTPEPFEDIGAKNGIHDHAECFEDVDGDGVYTEGVDIFDPEQHDEDAIWLSFRTEINGPNCDPFTGRVIPTAPGLYTISTPQGGEAKLHVVNADVKITDSMDNKLEPADEDLYGALLPVNSADAGGTSEYSPERQFGDVNFNIEDGDIGGTAVISIPKGFNLWADVPQGTLGGTADPGVTLLLGDADGGGTRCGHHGTTAVPIDYITSHAWKIEAWKVTDGTVELDANIEGVDVADEANVEGVLYSTTVLGAYSIGSIVPETYYFEDDGTVVTPWRWGGTTLIIEHKTESVNNKAFSLFDPLLEGGGSIKSGLMQNAQIRAACDFFSASGKITQRDTFITFETYPEPIAGTMRPRPSRNNRASDINVLRKKYRRKSPAIIIEDEILQPITQGMSSSSPGTLVCGYDMFKMRYSIEPWIKELGDTDMKMTIHYTYPQGSHTSEWDQGKYFTWNQKNHETKWYYGTHNGRYIHKRKSPVSFNLYGNHPRKIRINMKTKNNSRPSIKVEARAFSGAHFPAWNVPPAITNIGAQMNSLGYVQKVVAEDLEVADAINALDRRSICCIYAHGVSVNTSQGLIFRSLELKDKWRLLPLHLKKPKLNYDFVLFVACRSATSNISQSSTIRFINNMGAKAYAGWNDEIASGIAIGFINQKFFPELLNGDQTIEQAYQAALERYPNDSYGQRSRKEVERCFVIEKGGNQQIRLW